jgi:transcriptional regulator with XRE-family HTH domain
MDEVTLFRSELGARIAEVVSQFPTKAAAAEAAGVTPEQLNRWISGQVKVPVDGLWRLAKAREIDFSWLCTGPSKVVGMHPRMFQPAALRDALMCLAEVTATEGLTFKSPEKYAELVFALHDFLIERRARDGADADLTGMDKIIVLASK